MIPSDIAKKSLRKAAVNPDVEVVERTSYSFTPKVWVDGKISDKPYCEAIKEMWASHE
ncbi:TPA: hypothetical protein ACH3X1_011125 [Trebouxia sp. C0004]